MASPEFNEEKPIRSEILSAPALASEAERLARHQVVAPRGTRGVPLAPRVAENRRQLEKCYRRILEALHGERAITPAGEWLIDNFHIVRAQLQDVRDHLPASYDRGLPKLANGEFAGYPRVYALAWAFVAATDSRFDPELLRVFTASFQKIQPLTMGELWALPITLRVVLIENLRRLASAVVFSQDSRQQADILADEIMGLSSGPSRSLDEIVKELGRRGFNRPFAVQLMQRLRFQDARFHPVLEWVDRRLSAGGLTAEEVVAEEHARQAAANATVRNIITSARSMSSFSWPDFFEDVSLVEGILRGHADYGAMDFASRDRYRHAIEELARHARRSEEEVARRAVEKAQAASSPREKDPGYSLISSGRRAFEKEIGFRLPFRTRGLRLYRSRPLLCYLGMAGLLTLVLCALPAASLGSLGPAWAFGVVLLILLGSFPASEIALSLWNRITIAWLGPRHLPRFSFENGIPEEFRTIVVVPTMLTDENRVDAQVGQLEVHALSNPEDELYFALLTDGADADVEWTEKDERLVARAAARVEELNLKHGLSAAGHPRFHLFHRRRRFNAAEGKWMGWERKRGKLEEFNRLLLGVSGTSYLPINGREPSPPPRVKYVLTLDADTRLPNGAAVQLVGTMAHPLNRPELDEGRGVVRRGYGMLQPRVTPVLPEREDSTAYQILSTGRNGIDPYASAVSDVYQDLFGEGSFTGKGIYDVEVFERVLGRRVPENSLLSHDLFEGSFARCGFLSDVEVFEDFPSHTQVAAARSHRWIRGDWQLLPWIFGRRGRDLSSLGRWKMLDNLRRSVVAPATFVTLVFGLAFPAARAWAWLALLSLGIPVLITLIEICWPGPSIPWRQRVTIASEDLVLSLRRWLMNLILLPSQAWNALDAVVRALYRQFVSHRLMLEWTTAAAVKAAAGRGLGSFVAGMKGALLLTAFATAVWIGAGAFEAGTGALLALWFASPLLAWQYSRPPAERRAQPLSEDDTLFLRETARRIWQFFAVHVTAAENHLPPDNLQEDPAVVIAHRSSPTNFGLYLLSTVAARDFGWIGLVEMTRRLQASLDSMAALPRHGGHFYNWYETTGARALDPKYISSVDNGNLAGHLLAVAQACRQAAARSPFPARSAVADSLRIYQQTLDALPTPAKDRDVIEDLRRLVVELREICESASERPRVTLWEGLAEEARVLVRRTRRFAEGHADPRSAQLVMWAEAFLAEVESHAEDFGAFGRWRLCRVEGPASRADVQAELENLRKLCARPVSLADVSERCRELRRRTENWPRSLGLEERDLPGLTEWREDLKLAEEGAELAAENLLKVARTCHEIFWSMDFSLLYDESRRLFSIGYRVAEEQLDSSSYDLLASEARLTSFIAVAKGDVPATHWFRLGRPLVAIGRDTLLASWSGSMFEYLMPALVMRDPENSLIDESCRKAVHRQIQYGRQRGVPWGISEAAYNKRDLHLTYQYSNFGVPGLGLKRGLGADLVVAPYATLLALPYEPGQAVANLRRLREMGAFGVFGFYESVDFSPQRLPAKQDSSVVRAYMAHHQGMSLVSILNFFRDGLMRERFHAEPLVHATDLLLQERTPRSVGVERPVDLQPEVGLIREETVPSTRVYHDVNRPVPTTQILSNGDYSVLVTSSGSGYSRYREMAVTRWREDVTKDDRGSFIYLRDRQNGRVWSAGFQPTGAPADFYEVSMADDRVRLHREDGSLTCETEILVSPEDQVEIRRLKITNNGDSPRDLDVTSYAEVVLNSQAADAAHPAFSNLFVQTEAVKDYDGLLATRRPRSATEAAPWAAHWVVRDRHSVGGVQHDTDRATFLGRGRSVRRPDSVHRAEPLAHRSGAVLDPIFSLRASVHLEPGLSCQLIFYTGVAGSRADALKLMEKFREPAAFARVTDLAWTHSQVRLHHFNMEPDEGHLYQRLAARIVFLDPSLRAPSDLCVRCRKDVTGLWSQGISGDHPLVVARIDDYEDRAVVRQLLKAHAYLNSKGLTYDLVILNDQANSYAQDLQNSLISMVYASRFAASSEQRESRGKVFVLRWDLMAAEDRLLLLSTARAIFSSRAGSLAEQVKRTRFDSERGVAAERRRHALAEGTPASPAVPELQFFNGIGGFSPDGREYVIVQKGGQRTPAPWINVISDGKFGFHVSESGVGFTWSMNSRENQITPWSNDPVGDPAGEALYIQDLENGWLWSPTASPIRHENGTYVTRHAHGSSTFEYSAHGIAAELTQFVPVDVPAKVSRLRLRNDSGRARRLAVSAYVEWVLGFSRSQMAPSTVTEIDEKTGAMLALNPRSPEFGSRVSFFTFLGREQTMTGDRTEFLGRNGDVEAPAALFREKPLSGKVGGGFDPCGALRTELTLAPGETVELVLVLGQCEHRERVHEALSRVQGFPAERLLEEVHRRWDDILDRVQVETPDPAMNLMLNRWLLYQTLACRFWARAAFYQAGGAYGFRDQLQDVMALTWSRPDLAREHILRAAARQFVEGDVQHWWHPPSGRGVRTHFSDDLVWLPYVVANYLDVTADRSILDETASFLVGPELAPEQEDSYFTPAKTSEEASLFEHCARALDRSLRTGPHGLPLIGSGDWNDGMNRVGHEGRGESVWMSWFLILNLRRFADIAAGRGEGERAERWRDHAEALRMATEREAWDGDWYRRAYFDDGTPLGMAAADECRIDSLTQTWAVISGAAESARAKHAMDSVDRMLVRPRDRMILLFTPPFDKTPLDPGYIRGYLPGVRENGGQYTHAAVWCVVAWAALGQGQRALELFRMLNPIAHASSAAARDLYKVEPYALAADVYSQPPSTGRGGWTWYTGSCGWLYRAGLESLLGFKMRGSELRIEPAFPASWDEYKLTYRHGSSVYEIRVRRRDLGGRPGENISGPVIALVDDGRHHQLTVLVDESASTAMRWPSAEDTPRTS